MKVEPSATVAELMARFPAGFSIGPGTPEAPGELSRIVAASSYLSKIAAEFPMPEGNQGYLVVDIDPPPA